MRRKLARKHVQTLCEARKVLRRCIRRWVVSRVRWIQYQKSVVAATVLARHVRGLLARRLVSRLRVQIEIDEVTRSQHEQDYLEHELHSKLATFATFLNTSVHHSIRVHAWAISPWVRS
jgi:hypothetical protein